MDEELRSMLNEQTELLRSIRRAQRMSTVFSAVRLALFLIPIIIALLVLPPIISDYLDLFKGAAYPQEDFTIPQGFDLNDFRSLLERN